MLAILAPMGLIAPVYYGWIYDTHSSYDIAFITALVMAAVAAVTIFFVRSPRPLQNDNNSAN
jgi:hypothetical protein